MQQPHLFIKPVVSEQVAMYQHELQRKGYVRLVTGKGAFVAHRTNLNEHEDLRYVLSDFKAFCKERNLSEPTAYTAVMMLDSLPTVVMQ